jgi:hypothetical protein
VSNGPQHGAGPATASAVYEAQIDQLGGMIGSEPNASEGSRQNFLLAELRCAALRSRLMTADIDSISTALRGNFITTDDAIAWLSECGGLHFVSARRPADEPEASTA